MVTLDPERDTTQALSALARRYNLDRKRWKLVRPEPNNVREIAAVLGIKYRRLKSGNINHTAEITLLDENGVSMAKVNGTSAEYSNLTDDIQKLAAMDK